MGAAVAESTGECLVLGRGFIQLLTDLFMTGITEYSWCGHGIIYLQRMMGRMTTQAVADDLAFNMGFMTLGTVRDLAVHLMTEGT